MLCVAHRGASLMAPENTLAAFEMALDLNMDGVEFDVRLSADGHPIIIHDPTLERTTNGSGCVADLSLAELRQWDAGSWKASDFAGQRIPTLCDTLLLLRGRATPVIELKAPGTVEPTVRLLRELAMDEDAIICSFHEELIAEVAEVCSCATRALIFGGEDQPRVEDLWFAAAHRVGATWLSIAESLLTPARVDILKAENLAILAWTVNTEKRMRELMAMEVAGIVSDDASLLMRVCELP